MKDQIARCDIYYLRRDVVYLEGLVDELRDKFIYRDCPKCKRSTLQLICKTHIPTGIFYSDGFYRCTLCDSLISCHPETRCEVIKEEK